MNGVMRKLAALILAVAMITTFTPLYGAGAIAYAEDETVAAEQDNTAAENADPEGTAAGDENLAPAEGMEVTGTEGTEEDLSTGENGEEEVVQGEEVGAPEVPEDGEEQPPLMKAPQAGNLRNGEVEVTLSINKTTLEIMEEIPFEIEVSESVARIAFFRDATNTDLEQYHEERWDTDSFSYSDTGRNYCYGQPGTYSAIAIAYSRGENNEFIEIGRSNTIELTVTKRGDPGELSITSANGAAPGDDGNIDLTITRGEVMTVDYSEAENANNYWIDVYDDKDDKYLFYFGETGELSYSFSTIELAPGNYHVYAAGNAIGYSDRVSSNYINLTVLDREESEMYLNVSKTELRTCESAVVSAYYPGAAHIKVFYNSKDDRGWNDQRDGDVYFGGTQYRNSGVYELLAVAYDNEDNELASKIEIITVTAENGDIPFEMPDLPQYLQAGTGGDDLSFTVNKPEIADGIRAEVWFDLDDWDGDNRLYDKETYKDGGSLAVNINNNRLMEGMRIVVKISAWGPGYDETWKEVRIPVIAAISDEVTITAELDEGEDVWVNQNVRVRVAAANEGTRIERVRFFDGRDFWWEEDADDDGQYVRDIGFDEAGTYSVFAKVRLEGAGEDDWVYTEPISIDVRAEGKTGDFNITGLKVNGKTVAIGEDAIKVTRGDTLEFTCTEAEHADHYWVDAIEYREEDGGNWWEWYDHYSDTYQPVVTFNTIALREGLYRLEVGANGERFENTHASEDIYIEVSDLDIGDEEMYFEVSKTDLVTCEDFTYAVYCPNADWIEVFMNGREDGWRDQRDGDACTATQNYNSSGEYELVAVAHGYDEEDDEEFEIERSKIIRVSAPEGSLDLELPEGLPSFIVEGTDKLEFTVNRPDAASAINADVWAEFEYGERNVFRNQTHGESLYVSIDTADLGAGDRLNVRIEAWGYGYEFANKEIRIPVIAAPSNEVIITPEQTTVFVNQEVEVTVAAADENAQIDRVRLFDGEEFLGEEDADDEGRFTRPISFGRARIYSVFAEVKLRGSDEWITCEPVEITATTKGVLNIEKPASLGSHYDPGEDGDLVLSIPQPDNASMTRMEIWDSSGKVDYMCMGSLDEFTAKISQARLEYGALLYVRIAGWGIGYEYTDKQFAVPIEKHQWGDWKVAKKATLTSAGQEKRICALDNAHVQTKPIPKNNMKSAPRSTTLTASATKATTFTATKAFKITNAKGKVAYAKSSGDSKITVSKTGTVTVKKGLKKGKTYSVKVKVTSAATTKYAAATQTVTLKIKIK